MLERVERWCRAGIVLAFAPGPRYVRMDGGGGDPLPLRQESDEISGRDGLDLAPQAIERTAVDPCEESPRAPLRRPRARREPPAHREPFRLERREPRLDARGGEAGGVGEGFGGHGAENLEPGPQDLGERRVLRPALVRGPRRRLDRRNDPRRGEKGPERREALRRDPEPAARPISVQRDATGVIAREIVPCRLIELSRAVTGLIVGEIVPCRLIGLGFVTSRCFGIGAGPWPGALCRPRWLGLVAPGCIGTGAGP